MKNDIKKVCKIRKSQANIKHTIFSSSLYLLFTKKLPHRRKKKNTSVEILLFVRLF